MNWFSKVLEYPVNLHVHLNAHLETSKNLSAKQIELYNELRGYSSGDPCGNITPGHDPLMWKLLP
jgi:hypothetical protein